MIQEDAIASFLWPTERRIEKCRFTPVDLVKASAWGAMAGG